jgi:hypothetical protein
VKVVAELGIPGLVVGAWFGFALCRQLWRAMRAMRTQDPIRARLFYGLAAFGAANASVFVTAYQVFGDPMVLLVLGYCFGFSIALLGPSRAPSRAPAPAAQPAAPVLKRPVPLEIG